MKKRYYVFFLDENYNEQIVLCSGYDNAVRLAKNISKLSNMVTKACYEFEDVPNDYYDIGYYYNGKRDNKAYEIGIPEFIKTAEESSKEFDKLLRKYKFNCDEWRKLLSSIS